MSAEVSKIIDQLQVRVDEANQKAAVIISEAEAKAQKILADAQTSADKKLQAVAQENERREKAHQEKLKQAVRDTLIELKEKTLQAILNKTFDTTLQQPLNSPQLVEKAILTMGREFGKTLASDLKVLLGPELFDKLAITLKQKADEVIKAGLVVELDTSLKGGFKLGPAKEGYIYDFSEKALIELFSTAYGTQIEAQIFAGDK